MFCLQYYRYGTDGTLGTVQWYKGYGTMVQGVRYSGTSGTMHEVHMSEALGT